MLNALFLAESNAAPALAEAGDNPVSVFDGALRGHIDILNHPDKLMPTLTQIHPVWAAIFVIVGALCVINGYRWHKAVILLLAGMVGVGVGVWFAKKMGDAHVVSGASFAALFVILALPGLRFAAALFGGVAGAFCGANAWTAFGGDPATHQWGAIMGLLVLAMLAFIAFRIVIVLFTAIGGATMLIGGATALLLRVDAWNQAMSREIHANHLIIPLLVAVTAIVSVVIQQGGGFKGLYAQADKCAAKKGAPKPA